MGLLHTPLFFRGHTLVYMDFKFKGMSPDGPSFVTLTRKVDTPFPFVVFLFTGPSTEVSTHSVFISIVLHIFFLCYCSSYCIPAWPYTTSTRTCLIGSAGQLRFRARALLYSYCCYNSQISFLSPSLKCLHPRE